MPREKLGDEGLTEVADELPERGLGLEAAEEEFADVTADLQKEVNDLKQQLAKLQQQSADQQKQLNRSKAEKLGRGEYFDKAENLGVEITTVQGQINAVGVQIAEIKSNFASQNRVELDSINDMLENLKNERDTVKGKRVQVEGVLSALEGVDISSVQNTIKELKEKITEYTEKELEFENKRQELEQSLESVMGKINELEDQLKEPLESLERLEKQRDELMAKKEIAIGHRDEKTTIHTGAIGRAAIDLYDQGLLHSAGSRAYQAVGYVASGGKFLGKSALQGAYSKFNAARERIRKGTISFCQGVITRLDKKTELSLEQIAGLKEKMESLGVALGVEKGSTLTVEEVVKRKQAATKIQAAWRKKVETKKESVELPTRTSDLKRTRTLGGTKPLPLESTEGQRELRRADGEPIKGTKSEKE